MASVGMSLTDSILEAQLRKLIPDDMDIALYFDYATFQQYYILWIKDCPGCEVRFLATPFLEPDPYKAMAYVIEYNVEKLIKKAEGEEVID